MSLPPSVVVLSARPEQYALAIETLRQRNVATRCSEGPFRLAVEFAQQPADVVVMDIEWFGPSVLELLDLLRGQSPNTGVVIVATAAQRDLAAGALCNGADILLTKPAFAAEIVEAVDRAYRRRRLAESAAATSARPEGLAGFALGVAHEINNPLATISGWLQMLIADHAQDAALAERLASIKEEADRIAEVVRQLLLMAQQRPPRQDAVDLNRLFNELHRAYAVAARDRGITFTAESSGGLPAVCGDATQLRQACEILLADALSACGDSGRVTLRFAARNGGVEIAIHDSGPTLTADDLARLFAPFQGGRQTTGSGVGLTLAQSIAASHGGTVTAECPSSGGTQFTVWLPALQERS